MPPPPEAAGKRLAAIHPNAGITAELKARIQRELEAMHREVLREISAAYRDNPPEMALDAIPAHGLRAAMNRLGRVWRKRFEEMAPKIGAWFAQSAATRSDHALATALKDAGWSVKLRMTPAARDVLQASVHESVNLIKTIPQQYLSQVETMVMQSVQQGRNLKWLAEQIQAQYGLAKNRAVLIARDQNNKATAAMMRARQDELGIKRAIWLHSGGGKHPRKAHVAFSGKSYDIAKGAWLHEPGKGMIHTWPGVEINCRCVSQSIIPGL